nr:upstream activation factor subunit UAF30-like isoform X3 [Ipomoea batatas]GMC74516.1 upstream activation factor subunit UAF30-like isoform X3 [Ipomoea batatas]GMC75515.1 upstream activation factor subunit UAF30-like isoform X3 [Ipomoea batatas]GMC76516.1 upstream activation factor subunit UAF30-like isoform X3 [Ipomoea batatas]
MSVEGGAAAAAMVSDEDIAQALVSVLRDANPSEPLSLDGVLPPEYAAHFPQNYGFRPLHPPPPPMLVSNSEPFPSSAASTAVPHAHEVAPAPEPPKLVHFIQIVKQLWAYIRKHNLQDPNNKRKIICNDELRLVFETDCTDMFKMNKLLAKHITRLEPSEPTVQILQNTKRIKTDEETGSRTDESVQIVIISEALANFFGTSEREMSQAEVLRQVWEYIKVNQLEDPINSMAIQCDAKLQQLLGCESISALGVPEMLARHHLSKRS